MTVENLINQTIAQAGWDGLLGAGSQAASGVASFIFQMVMIGLLFWTMFGVLFHFTHYSKSGAKMIVEGIVGLIIIGVIYTCVLGPNLPDLSVWFTPPS